MADFETRIDDLTGFGSNTDRNAIDDWLTAGARTVLNILPLNKLLLYVIAQVVGCMAALQFSKLK